MSSRLGAALFVGLVLVATLWPMPHLSVATATLGVHIEFQTSDFARNMLMLAPLGLLLGGSMSARRVLGLAVAVSLGIEILQLLLPGRVSSPWDVLANGAGALLGCGLRRALDVGLLREEPMVRRGYLVCCAGVIAALLGGAALFRVHLPDPPYYTAFLPDRPHYETYEGTVAGASIAGIALPRNDRIDDEPVLRAVAGDFTMTVRGTTGQVPGRLSPLVRVTDYGGSSVATVAAIGRHLVLGQRTLGNTLRFDQHFSAAIDAFDPEPRGRPFEIRAWRAGRRVCVAVDGREHCDLGPRFRESWRHWLPSGALARPTIQAVGAVWLALLFVPLGFGFRVRVVEAGALATVIGAALCAPLIGPVTPPTIGDGALAATGFAAGAAAGAAWRRALQRREADRAGRAHDPPPVSVASERVP